MDITERGVFQYVVVRAFAVGVPVKARASVFCDWEILEGVGLGAGCVVRARVAGTFIDVHIAIAGALLLIGTFQHLTLCGKFSDECVVAQSIGVANLAHATVRMRRHRRVIRRIHAYSAIFARLTRTLIYIMVAIAPLVTSKAGLAAARVRVNLWLTSGAILARPA